MSVYTLIYNILAYNKVCMCVPNGFDVAAAHCLRADEDMCHLTVWQAGS